MTVAQLCDDYEKATGQQWAQTIGCHAKLSWAIDVLKRAKNLDDKQTIVDALATTKLELITGPVDMTSPVDPAGLHVSATIYKQGWANAQVVKGPDAKPTPSKWPMDQNLVGQSDWPTVQVFDPIPQAYQ
jgi:hypothetical protein